jgi:hypothetical protein
MHLKLWRDVSSVRPSPPVSWKPLDQFFYYFAGWFPGLIHANEFFAFLIELILDFW